MRLARPERKRMTGCNMLLCLILVQPGCSELRLRHCLFVFAFVGCCKLKLQEKKITVSDA